MRDNRCAGYFRVFCAHCFASASAELNRKGRYAVFEGREFDRIYLAAGYTDMRAGINGLASIVQEVFHLNPFTNCLFLFCGRRADRFKAIYWDGSGFVLTYKRIETGRVHWPRKEQAAIAITNQQLRWLLEGLSPTQKQAIPTLQDPRLI